MVKKVDDEGHALHQVLRVSLWREVAIVEVAMEPCHDIESAGKGCGGSWAGIHPCNHVLAPE